MSPSGFSRDGTSGDRTACRSRRQQAASRCKRSRDSAVRAVFAVSPYDMLKPEHYDKWKEIEFTFDPKEMFRRN